MNDPCRENPRLSGANLTVTFCPRTLRRHITWRRGVSVLSREGSEFPRVELADGEVMSFELDASATCLEELSHPELGQCSRLTVVGRAATRRSTLQAVFSVMLAEDFPDVLISQLRLSNVGSASVELCRVDVEHMLLDRRLGCPTAAPYEFAAYLGAAQTWGTEYNAVRLAPAFFAPSFFGRTGERVKDGAGGGVPLIDVWCPEMGVALAHIEPRPEWLRMPLAVREDGLVEASITDEPSPALGQRSVLRPGEQYDGVTTALIFHRGDYHDALRTLACLLRRRGVAIPETSPNWAYEPYWKTWGYRTNFSVSDVLAEIPRLESFGIRHCNIDDGWFDFAGDWNPNPSLTKFPEGDASVIELVRRIHEVGMKTSLWWYPLGVHPESRLARERPELLVQCADGRRAWDPNDLHQLCPAYGPARELILEVLERILGRWGFDGLYLDFCGLSAVPACFNPAHRHASPLEPFHLLPQIFRDIHAKAHGLREEPLIEVCICSFPHSPYCMPYYGLANASDPTTLAQARRRIKEQKAIHGPTFAVGDCYQVPAHEWAGASIQESFETSIGCGAQLTTMHRHLDPAQAANWQKWFRSYRTLGLSRGEYLNLYDIAFDKPEGHVVRLGRELFYAFYSDGWSAADRIELRGLMPSVRYEIHDYVRGVRLCTLSREEPWLSVGFKDALLLRAVPLD
jgi:alpha-galactosidase